MRYNLYKKKTNNIYEYEKCKYSSITEINFKNLFGEDYNEEDSIVIENDNNLAFPILDDVTKELREMTREEKIILLQQDVLLQAGEYIEDNNIIQVPNPNTEYLRYTWDRETFTWKLITTIEELQQTKTNLILQHNKKRKEISALNEESEYFDVSESVAKANDELEEIRAKINEIDKVIEEMNNQQ